MNGVFSEVARAWKGDTVAIIAGGASLTAEQLLCARSASIRTIAINDAHLVAPWADLLYFSDALWQAEQLKGVARAGLGLSFTAEQVAQRFREFPGPLCSLEQHFRHAPDDRLHILKRDFHHRLSPNPQYLVAGGNSAFAALNLAILAGAAKVVLLGVDAKPHGARTHWFGGRDVRTGPQAYDIYRRGFHDAQNEIKAAGVTVINASPGSAVTCFDYLPIEHALG